MNKSTSSVRPYPMEKHPIYTQSYVVPSDPISLIWQHVDRALRRREAGFVVWGRPRLGKSSAIKYLCAEAERRYPGLCAAAMDAELKNHVHERYFFASLCDCLKLDAHGGAFDCKRRCIDYMHQRALQNLRQEFLLFIDEPQKWTFRQFEWLREVYDKLERSNVRLLAILVGQRSLRETYQSLVCRDDGVTILRFMNYELEFTGIQSAGALAYVLEGYDTIIDTAPAWPFTRFFFPAAYDNGFRLQDVSQILWDSFVKIFREAGSGIPQMVPMKHITLAIELLFVEYHHLDAGEFELDSRLADELVAEVNFALYVAMSLKGQSEAPRGYR